MRRESEWGDAATLLAAAALFRVRIHVVSRASNAGQQVYIPPPVFGAAFAPTADIFIAHLIDLHALRGHTCGRGRERGRMRHRRARAHLVGSMPALLHAGRVGVRGGGTAPNWPARGRACAHARSVCEALSTARRSQLPAAGPQPHAVNVSVRALGMHATIAPGLCEVQGQCAEGSAPSAAIARGFEVDCCSCDACGTQAEGGCIAMYNVYAV